MADLLAVLYAGVARIDPSEPDAPERDRVIVSKGHAAAAVYAVLAECGFFDVAELDDYCADGSLLCGHVSHKVPGVEVSTGALGHGLPIGCGLAIAARGASPPYRVFTFLSDGELDEGSNWEALLFAGHHHLDNLVALVDFNRIQSFGSVAEVLDLGDIALKARAAGWSTREIDGHDHSAILESLEALPFETSKPNFLLAHTVKGKGVSFMENSLAWHYRSPTSEQVEAALAEIAAR
jgi:transketolase